MENIAPGQRWDKKGDVTGGGKAGRPEVYLTLQKHHGRKGKIPSRFFSAGKAEGRKEKREKTRIVGQETAEGRKRELGRQGRLSPDVWGGTGHCDQ